MNRNYIILINILLLVTCLCSYNAHAQVRKDFTKVRFSESKTDGYGLWQKTDASLVYELKAGKDIKLYWKGDLLIVRSVVEAFRKEIGEGSGNWCHAMTVLDEKGEEFLLMIFDTGRVVFYDVKRGKSMQFGTDAY